MGFSVELSTGTKKKNFHIAGQADVIAKYNEGYDKGFDEGYENGIVDGRTTEWSEFWDFMQGYGTRSVYFYTFANDASSYYGWNDENFKPKYNMKPTNANYMFSYNQVTNIKQVFLNMGKTIDFSSLTVADYTFQHCKTIELPELNFTRITSLKYTFTSCNSLITIDKLILNSNGTTSFSSVFNSCNALENIVINGVIGKNGFNVSWSTKLTHDSLMSIINALQDKSTDTSGTIWTVTIGATNIAKLTDVELQIAYDKGWVVA